MTEEEKERLSKTHLSPPARYCRPERAGFLPRLVEALRGRNLVVGGALMGMISPPRRSILTGLCEARKLDGELCCYKARASSLPFCGVHWKGKAE